MPSIPRRRLPVRRTSTATSVSSSPSRRHVETKNLVTASDYGGLDIGGSLRAVLLGAFVGGLVIFLFYPDISSLMERWQNTSEQSRFQQLNVPEGEQKHDGMKKNSRPLTKKELKDKPEALPAENSSKPKPVPKKKSANAVKQPRQPSRPESPGECSCKCKKTAPPSNSQYPSSTSKKKAKKSKSPQKNQLSKEDLMEEEELEVEEEDSMEVELMEEEETVERVYVQGKDGDSGTEPTDRQEELLRAGQKSSPIAEDPLIAKEGQPIVFTPVNPGDETIIRLGGKHDEDNLGGKAKTENFRSRPKEDKFGGRPKSDKETPSKETKNKGNAESKAPKKPNADGTLNAKKSPTKEKPKMKSVSSALKKDSAAPSDDDLAEKVRNFKHTYLKTVTAKKIFADGRRIPPVELLPQKETNSSVKVFLFNEFLSEAECDGLRRVHDKHVQAMAAYPVLCFDSITTLRKHVSDVRNNVHVTPNDFVQGTKCLNASFSQQLGTWMSGNWSYSTAFYPGESRFSSIFAARVQQAMGLENKNGGKFQITSYPTGKAYKAHTDCVLGGNDERDRVATVLVYLDDVLDGGETKFPELGIWVKPRKGRALVWNNMSPQGVCEPHSLHAASRVNSGSKYILIRWYYYKNFYSLGMRPPEPSLPARPAGTPRVSCDEYDNGSCRWYDEWNNDHLLDYEYKKFTLI